jgi:alpha-amylase/alpha-mannosidase (GH57 family)
MSKKYVCIHGHFYQPPRENAWVEEIELQDSAAPYHDWNERITHECYRPNGVARVLNKKHKIVDIVNNYAHLSFNFGPTLLSWLKNHEPKAYQSVIDADKQSMVNFNGHGSAMAQVYNHIIMPLASRRDKETQVKWGIQDFRKHFNRDPEGMWLAETAVDIETLEVLAENKIKFTVLAPYQAKQYRRIGDEKWKAGIDSKGSYVCTLPSGNTINLFFYDGDNSQGVAFNGYLNDGKHFAKSLLSSFDQRQENQLVHIATDGESYGHHHKNGEMALASCMRYIDKTPDVTLTNYSEYLAIKDPVYEVEIVENTSWSCAHGVERWRSNCGCYTGGDERWHQEWRVGLRETLNWLRDELAATFEAELEKLNIDPWELRNGYVSIINDRSEKTINALFEKYISSNISTDDRIRIIRLLEMQKQSLYMFTSCGWFFNDVSGMETIQILQYANRAIQLAEETSGIALHEEFKIRLSAIDSNISAYGNTRDIYEKWVEPQRLSLTQVGMHYAVNALFESDDQLITVLNYDCESEVLERHEAGTMILLAGITSVVSRVTLSHKRFSFAIIYMGNHHLVGGTSNNASQEWFDELHQAFSTDFDEGNLAGIIDTIKEHFTEKTFSFYQLFKDEQAKLVNLVIDDKMKNALAAYENIYDSTYSLLNLLKSNRLSIPGLLENNLLTVFQYKLEEIFEGNGDLIQLGRLERYADEVSKWEAKLKTERISYLAARKISHLVNIFSESEDKSEFLANIDQTLRLLAKIDVVPDIELLQEFIYRKIRNNQLTPDELELATNLADLIDIKIN